MRQHRHLRDARQEREVHGAQVQVLQVHGGRNREGVAHVNLVWHARGVLVLHDVRVLQLHLVLSIERPEAAMQALRVDVVDVERPRRSSIAARRLTSLALLGRLLLQLLLHPREGIHGHVARPLAPGHGPEDGVVALRQDLLATLHARRRREPELGRHGACLEEPLCRVEVCLDGCGDVRPLDRRREGAVVADGGHRERAIVNWRPAPRRERVSAGLRLQVRREDDVHVAIGDVGEEVEDAREEVHVALGEGRKAWLLGTALLPAPAAGNLREAPDQQGRPVGTTAHAGGPA
mmetsp:Transcript_93283/g.208814  ORF Transcript_93283/g.208814 Transcript_93283/m.208814 type:complete len:292 (-) Transcript_93283:282-1157(-)